MKVLVILAVLAGGYTFALLQLTSKALGSVQSIYNTDNSVAAATEAWSNGDTSVSLTGAH